MFSGEDTDNTHSDEINKSQPITKPTKPTTDQMNTLVELAETKNISYEDLHKYCSTKYKVGFANIKSEDYAKLLTHIKEIKAKV